MPAGRPRSFDGDAVLEAAIDVFRRHGYEAASLDLLTEAMGINRPSLYGAFGDKASLFDKAVSHYVEGPGALPVRALADAVDLTGAIEGFFAAVERNNCARGRPRGCLVACVLGEAAGADDRWRARATELTRAAENAATRALERHLPAHRAGDAARLMITLMYGIAALAKAGLPAAEIHAYTQLAIATTRAIFGTPPA